MKFGEIINQTSAKKRIVLDKKLNQIQELISGIKLIKINSWKPFF